MSENLRNHSRIGRNLRFSHLYWAAMHNTNNHKTSNSSIDDPAYARSDWGPLVVVPLLATIVLAISVFLLLVFRQNPTFVITTIAACIVFIIIYLTLSAMDTIKITYE